MLRLLGAVATAALAAASDPEVSVTCSGDTNVTISIAYTKPDVQLLNFASGICNETSGVEYMQNATSNEVTINMNMRDCGLRSQARVTRGLRTILFDNVAELALGRHDAGQDMIFYSNKVNLTCAVKDTYEVSIGYGQIDADYSAADAVSGGQKEFTFEIESTDADFNATQAPSARAGDTVYLKISSPDVDFFRYKFAVTTCKFTETNETNNAVTEYKLFDNTANDCKNNFLDFTMKYCNKTNSFGISHTVFTFDPTQANNYTLTCSIKLCDFDVTDSVAKCNDVESNCGIPTIEPLKIDGGWTDWTTWSPPNATKGCGDKYTKKRSRTCTNPEKQGAGADCDGDAEEEKMDVVNCETCKQYGFDLSKVMYYDGELKMHHQDLCNIWSHASEENCLAPAKEHPAVGGKPMSFKDSTDTTTTESYDEQPLHLLCPNLCRSVQNKMCNRKDFCRTPDVLTTQVHYRDGTGTMQIESCEVFLAFKEGQNAGDAEKLCKTPLKNAEVPYSLEKVFTKEVGSPNGQGEKWLDRNEDVSEACQNACAGYNGRDTCYHVPPVHSQNGNWADWTEWTEPADTVACDETYQKNRTRTCTKPEKRGFGTDCVGDAEEKENDVKTCTKPDCKLYGFDMKSVAYDDGSSQTAGSPVFAYDLCSNDKYGSTKKCEAPVKDHSSVRGRQMKFIDQFDNEESGLQEEPLSKVCPNLCVDHLADKDQTCKFKMWCKTSDTGIETNVYYKVLGKKRQQPCEAYLKMKEDENAGDAATICGTMLKDAETAFDIEKVQIKEFVAATLSEVESWLDRNDDIAFACQNACAAYGMWDACHHVVQ
jgi:hypothetical protein